MNSVGPAELISPWAFKLTQYYRSNFISPDAVRIKSKYINYIYFPFLTKNKLLWSAIPLLMLLYGGYFVMHKLRALERPCCVLLTSLSVHHSTRHSVSPWYHLKCMQCVNWAVSDFRRFNWIVSWLPSRTHIILCMHLFVDNT